MKNLTKKQEDEEVHTLCLRDLSVVAIRMTCWDS